MTGVNYRYKKYRFEISLAVPIMLSTNYNVVCLIWRGQENNSERVLYHGTTNAVYNQGVRYHMIPTCNMHHAFGQEESDSFQFPLAVFMCEPIINPLFRLLHVLTL